MAVQEGQVAEEMSGGDAGETAEATEQDNCDQDSTGDAPAESECVVDGESLNALCWKFLHIRDVHYPPEESVKEQLGEYRHLAEKRYFQKVGYYRACVFLTQKYIYGLEDMGVDVEQRALEYAEEMEMTMPATYSELFEEDDADADDEDEESSD